MDNVETKTGGTGETGAIKYSLVTPVLLFAFRLFDRSLSIIDARFQQRPARRAVQTHARDRGRSTPGTVRSARHVRRRCRAGCAPLLRVHECPTRSNRWRAAW